MQPEQTNHRWYDILFPAVIRRRGWPHTHGNPLILAFRSPFQRGPFSGPHVSDHFNPLSFVTSPDPRRVRQFSADPSAMALPRPYMPLRRTLLNLAPRTGRTGSRVPFRKYSTQGKPPKPEPFTVWRPYLRLAVGVPFIGALIYSMVSPSHIG